MNSRFCELQIRGSEKISYETSKINKFAVLISLKFLKEMEFDQMIRDFFRYWWTYSKSKHSFVILRKFTIR